MGNLVDPLNKEVAEEFFNHYAKKLSFSKTLTFLNDVRRKEIVFSDVMNFISLLIEYLKEDFLTNTNGDLISYNIVFNLFKKHFEEFNKRQHSKRRPPLISEKEELIDNNLLNIINLYENKDVKELNNRDLRFYLLLLALIILSDVSYDIVDKYFIEFLTYEKNKSEKKRKNLVRTYLMHDNGIRNKDGMLVPEIHFLRNQVSHGWFLTNGHELTLHPDGKKENAQKFTYEEVLEIYNFVQTKIGFLKLLESSISIMYHIEKQFIEK